MALSTKEVELKGRALSKAAAGGDPSSTILSLLDELRRGVVASEDILRTTKIGVSVNKLKQHKDSAVARQSAELVSKWRTDIRSKGHASSGNSTPKVASGSLPSGGTASAQKNGLSSPAAKVASPTPAAAGVKAKHTVPKEKRNAKLDGVDHAVTGNATRDACVKLMYDGLAFMSEELPNEILRVARSVETAAYEAYQPETSPRYKEKLRSLYQNLKVKSNDELRLRVLTGDITPAKFVRMTHDELKSAERRKEDEKLMKMNMDKAMVAQEEKSVSTQLKCGKCGQRKVSYTQAQTRSADEPMTTFCECVVCGNRWKFS